MWRGLPATTLFVFHAASAVADAMALFQSWSLPIALNLAVRITMVVLLAAFYPRRPATQPLTQLTDPIHPAFNRSA